MKQKLTILLLTLLSLIFLYPLLTGKYIETDDGLWAVVRQASLHRELRQGQFPVRWSGSLNFGYGYPLFNFSYPGPYYVGELFKLVGFNFIWSVKLVFIFATILSIIGIYLFAKELWKNELAGLIAALFYLSGPYRILNTYVRGSIGEIVAFALFPFLCYAGIKLLATGKRRYILIGSSLLGFLIISHNIMALLFLPFFILFLLGEIFLRYVKFSVLLKAYIEEFQNRKKGFKDNFDKKLFLNHIHLVVVMLVIGVGLSAFFWLPAITELQYTKLGIKPLTNIHQEFSKTHGLLVTPLDNRSQPDPNAIKNFSQGMMYVHLTVLFASILILLFYRKNYQVATHRVLLYLAGYLVALAFLSPYSETIWKNTPGLKVVDFPWRMYGILMFIRPIIVGAVALIPRMRYVGLVLAVIPLITGIHSVENLKYVNYPSEYYATNQGTTTSANEYLNKWVTQPVTQREAKFIRLIGNTEQNVTTTERHNNSTSKSFTYTATQPQQVQLALMYFPGWKVFLDGKEHQFSYKNSNGIINTQLSPGTHTLDVVFEDTPMRTAANSISITTFIIVCITFSIQYIRGKRFVL